MANRLFLSREQLSAFLKDFQSIREFEKLFTVASPLTDGELDALSNQAGSALSQAIEALDRISDLADDLHSSIVSIEVGNENQIHVQDESQPSQDSFYPDENIDVSGKLSEIEIIAESAKSAANEALGRLPSGASGSFIAGLNTITVVNGIITSIA
jgi:hypothetical protein